MWYPFAYFPSGELQAASTSVNPRLIQRLEAFRAYRGNGGTMEMADWVSHTQGAPWGTGFKSGYADWIRSVESVHGNSALSPRSAYLYKLVDQDGNFLKWGITQDLNTRYPKWYMEDKKIFRVNEGSRAEMLRLEREMVETQPGPWNHEPWAGKRKP